MRSDISQVTPTAYSRILIAENNTSTAESLIHSIQDSRLDVEYDVCTSYNSAVIQLFRSPPPYKHVISSVHLAEIDDFLLLKHNRLLQPDVPFVITAGAETIEPSRRALDEGAFDLIAMPLEAEQTVETIRLALWHGELKALFASKERMLEKYRQHIAHQARQRASERLDALRKGSMQCH